MVWQSLVSIYGERCGREKVGNIFSFGVPLKIAVEMRLCFMAVIQAQNAADRRDREEETGSGQQKQDDRRRRDNENSTKVQRRFWGKCDFLGFRTTTTKQAQ